MEQLRAAEGWRSQLDRLTARHAELQAAVEAAEQNYIVFQGEGEQPAGELGVNASLAQRALAADAPANGLDQTILLLLSLLAAACAAVGAAVLADPGQKPVSHVADIATAAGVPVLMMIEETQSNVS